MMHEHDETGAAPAEPAAWAPPAAEPVAGIHAWAHPVVMILTMAGVADALSGNPLDGALLVGAAVALGYRRVIHGAERVEHGGWAGPIPRRSLIGGIMLAAAVALVAGGFETGSWPMTFAVVVPGVAGVTRAWRGPLGRRPFPASLPRIGTALWAAVFVTLGLWELTNLLLQPSLTVNSWDHPTLSTLVDPLLMSHLGRSAGLFVWLVLGWYLVER